MAAVAEPSDLICGAVRFDHPAAHHLVASLPAVIHLRPGSSLDRESMHGILRLMAAEARERRPGGEAVITRLGDIVVVQAIRAWIETDPAARTGWLGALRDPHVGRAITLIHRDPARAWTLASLAGEVAMSRSAFAARFTELVGEPAMAYVARWRMHLAVDALRRPRLERRRARRPLRLPLRGGLRARLQARDRHAARRGARSGGMNPFGAVGQSSRHDRFHAHPHNRLEHRRRDVHRRRPGRRTCVLRAQARLRGAFRHALRRERRDALARGGASRLDRAAGAQPAHER